METILALFAAFAIGVYFAQRAYPHVVAALLILLGMLLATAIGSALNRRFR